MKKGNKRGKKNGPRHPKLSGNSAGVTSLGNLIHRNTGSRFQPGNPHRFKPGKSYNPGGKPSEQRAVSLQVINDQLGSVHPKLGKSALERIVAHTIRRALQGSYKDIKLLLNYALGMPSQILEHSGSLDLTRIIREARERGEAAEADLAALPAPTDANGAIRRAQAAAEAAKRGTASEDAAEQQAKPKIRVEPWAN